MSPFTVLTLIISYATVTLSQTFTPFQDSISAQGLLGSYFGIPGSAKFDYVIVGGGTAGLTLANRLAANGSYSVAVIEAGGFSEMDNGNASAIPGSAGSGLGWDPADINPLIDWEQYTTPQPGLNGRVSAYAQGKTLGGNSVRNSMWYHRSTAGAYQQWADEVNDQSYTFNNLLPYFEKSVNFTPPTYFDRPANATALYDPNVFSPSGGPLHVSYSSWVNSVSSWLSLSLNQLGLVQVPGFTDGNLLGWSYIAVTIDPTTETRSSSETSFLRQSMQTSPNLAVYKNSLAKQIIFDDTKTATGVIVDTAGKTYNITANKEVILSSGVFRSPQLLMVSGIGPEETLASQGVPCIQNLEGVGQNMWDHFFFGPTYTVDVITTGSLVQPSFLAEQGELYVENRTGLFTNVGGDLLAFQKLPVGSVDPFTQLSLDAEFAADWPTIELFSINAYGGTLKDEVAEAPTDGRNYATVTSALVAPFSRGNVTINSTDTSDNPIISPNWLLDPRDRAVAVAAYKQARSVFHTPAIQPAIVGDEVFPGSNITTDAQILDELTQHSLTVYHAAATNKMGTPDDPMAVVDSHCKVFGVNNLRVVDASAFPFLPPGHPQGTVYALAEKLADDILQGS